MANNVDTFNRAMAWIRKNTVDGSGICVTNTKQYIYPEVTGYYIPTLLDWGERDPAIAYAKKLCSLQKEDGAWYDSDGRDPYIFDTAQILKGLTAIHGILPEVEENIVKGCDWLLSRTQEDGRLLAPDAVVWKEGEYMETIHIYCLSPLVDAARILNRDEYREAAERILAYYIEKERDSILRFSQISHFHAYVLEGLFDMGELDLCRQAMENLEQYRNEKGGIPAFNDVPWICSTGCFQLAVVWFKLGEYEKGNSLFRYACALQNPSGGWYGSYPASRFKNVFYSGRMKPGYFPVEEISWANKYFLDALAWQSRVAFEKEAPTFHAEIDRGDGRYQEVLRHVTELSAEAPATVCDAGCGRGRYLKRLKEDLPENAYYAVDVSETVLGEIEGATEKRRGSLTNIPFPDASFDVVYTCEALEHAVHIEGALRELYRVTKPGGRVVVIDKTAEKLGRLQLDPWEQWFSDDFFRRMTEELGGSLEIRQSVPYESYHDGLFRAWIVKK